MIPFVFYSTTKTEERRGRRGGSESKYGWPIWMKREVTGRNEETRVLEFYLHERQLQTYPICCLELNKCLTFSEGRNEF